MIGANTAGRLIGTRVLNTHTDCQSALAHNDTEGQFRVLREPAVQVLGIWEEAGVPKEKPRGAG